MPYSLIYIGKQKKHNHYSSDSDSSVNGISPVVIERSVAINFHHQKENELSSKRFRENIGFTVFLLVEVITSFLLSTMKDMIAPYLNDTIQWGQNNIYKNIQQQCKYTKVIFTDLK